MGFVLYSTSWDSLGVTRCKLWSWPEAWGLVSTP